MGQPVVTVASGGLPVVEALRGTPVTEAASGRGVPVTKVVGRSGLPVVYDIGGGGTGGGTLTGSAVVLGGQGGPVILTLGSAGAWRVRTNAGSLG